MSNAQALAIKRGNHQLVLSGNAMRDKIVAVMQGRFRHRCDDGSIFTPRIAGSLVWPGVAQVIVVDPQRLWHFSISRMSNQDTLDQMSLATGRPVRAIRRIPAGAMGNSEAREVMAYAILLKDGVIGSGANIPAVGSSLRHAALPKMADMEFLSHKPEGDYMIGLGVGETGEVWDSLPKMLHMAFIGTTGSGKSTSVRSFVYQLAKMDKPVELYLSDMEDVTFPWAENWPIVKGYARTDTEATEMTSKLMEVMNKRAALYHSTSKFPEKWQEYREITGIELPWVVAIFEEVSALADMTGKNGPLMHNLNQLLMRGRKYGITIAFSGQDFKADLFPSRVTNLIQTRLVHRTQTAQECRNALGLTKDEVGGNGADKISDDTPGRFVIMRRSKLEQVQGFFVPKAAVLGDSDVAGGTSAVEQGADGHVRARPHASFNKRDAEFVIRAVQDFDGWFMPDELAKAFGGSPSGHEFRRLAKKWANIGWLVAARKPNKGGKGATISRRVTDDLAQMAREVLEP